MSDVAAAFPQRCDRPAIKPITLDHPWQWIAKGWNDMKRAPRFSLAYGACFVLVSWLLTLGLLADGAFFVVPVLAAGFFLVAPLLGIGLYQISETLQRGEQVKFCTALSAWRRNSVHLWAMAFVLVLTLLAWMLSALLVFALLYDQPAPTWDHFIWVVLLSGESPAFLFTGTIVGAAIAFFTFSISVITVPMLMDRQGDVVEAMQTSLAAVRENWLAMGLWAALIVLFVGFGLLTYYLGLLVLMPIVGHGTWHAYRDLVGVRDAVD
ncbi:putative integral membrane protein [Thioflavicoccus mobilis 8321]|uniref:Putative integral membrane protein n=1 Tax=Thioflavicoccus mobilis 8321 TaxID=765912 RepID=L0H051_9GAMM|nr:DUF2189 domain-containing protein [Thioflavicoccus mobilis]AGA90985.1 putative integral membrane protein [Thioflavicoccus mobilis 8321]